MEATERIDSYPGDEAIHAGAMNSLSRKIAERALTDSDLVKLGESLYGIGLVDEARTCFSEAIRINPDNGVALNNLGVLSVEKDDLVAAVDYFERAVRFGPSCEEARSNLQAIIGVSAWGDIDANDSAASGQVAQTSQPGGESHGEIYPRTSSVEAFAALHANRENKWPSRARENRLEPLCAPAFRPTFTMQPGESVFTIGSCFARNIELALKNNGYKVPAFEFALPKEELYAGTGLSSGALNKYTPHSMLNEILYAFEDLDPDRFLVEVEGGYLDLQLHVNLPVSLARARERREQVRVLYRNAISESRVIVITLGLVEAWWDDHTQVYLNETPNRLLTERHPGRFRFEVLAPEAVFASIEQSLAKLKQYGRPDQRVILTVSPVPLTRTFTDQDVIVANGYSKSVLRTGAEIARRKFDWVDYYPSYESVMLSDRRFAWLDDLLHVTKDMVDFNVGRMLEAYQ